MTLVRVKLKLEESVFRASAPINQQAYTQTYQIPQDVSWYVSKTSDQPLTQTDWSLFAFVFYQMPKEQCIQLIQYSFKTKYSATALNGFSCVELAKIWLDCKCRTFQQVSMKMLANDLAMHQMYAEVKIVHQVYPNDFSLQDYKGVITEEPFQAEDYRNLLILLSRPPFFNNPVLIRIFGGQLGFNLRYLPQNITAEKLVEQIKLFDSQSEDIDKLKWTTVANSFDVLSEHSFVEDIQKIYPSSEREQKKIAMVKKNEDIGRWLHGLEAGYSEQIFKNDKESSTCLAQEYEDDIELDELCKKRASSPPNSPFLHECSKATQPRIHLQSSRDNGREYGKYHHDFHQSRPVIPAKTPSMSIELHLKCTSNKVLTEDHWYKVASVFYALERKSVLLLPVFSQSANLSLYQRLPRVDLALIWLMDALRQQETVTMATLAKELVCVGGGQELETIKKMFPNIPEENKHMVELTAKGLNTQDFDNLLSILKNIETQKSPALLRVIGGYLGFSYTELSIGINSETLIEKIKKREDCVELIGMTKWYDIAMACEKTGAEDIVDYIYKYYHRSIKYKFDDGIFMFQGVPIKDLDAFKKKLAVVNWTKQQKSLVATGGYESVSSESDDDYQIRPHPVDETQIDRRAQIRAFHACAYGCSERKRHTNETNELVGLNQPHTAELKNEAELVHRAVKIPPNRYLFKPITEMQSCEFSVTANNVQQVKKREYNEGELYSGVQRHTQLQSKNVRARSYKHQVNSCEPNSDKFDEEMFSQAIAKNLKIT